MKLRKTVEEGELIPYWYGFAWVDYQRGVSVVFPIPLNFLARWLRNFHIFLRGKRQSFYDKAYLDGYRSGYDSAEKYYRREMKTRDEEWNDEEWNRTVGLAILHKRNVKINQEQ